MGKGINVLVRTCDLIQVGVRGEKEEATKL